MNQRTGIGTRKSSENDWNSQSSFHIESPEAARVWFHPSDLQTNPWLADQYQPTETDAKENVTSERVSTKTEHKEYVAQKLGIKKG